MENNQIEIDLRGRFMTMACDVEWSLLIIMAYASPDPNKSKRFFQEMTMGNKIECAIADLKKHRPNYYEQHKETLEKLWEFHKMRNAMAHYRMTIFDYGNPVIIEMMYMGEERNLEVKKSRDYTLDQINDSITRFKELNLILNALAEQLKAEYLLTRGVIMKNNRITLTEDWKPIVLP